jgi:YihY family inner membrane protein
MEHLNRRLRWLDRTQRSNRLTGFGFAVIKKYGEDQSGHNAALLTYYGFLSLFPTLLITTTVVQWSLHADSHLRQRVITSVTNFFPIIGQQLQENVHGFSKTGLPLIVGFLVLIYGLRGVADVFRHVVNNVWRVPAEDRSGFWPALARSFSIILVAGLGFICSAIIASYAVSAGHHLVLRGLLILVSSAFVFGAFLWAVKIALNKVVRIRQIWVGAATVAIGSLILQNIGGYALAHELKNLNNLYGTFAVVLGLFFWLYLIAQLIVYALEIDSVRGLRLWPRSFMDNDKTS